MHTSHGLVIAANINNHIIKKVETTLLTYLVSASFYLYSFDVCVLVAQSCLTLCDPMGYSPPVSSVAISFSRGFDV